MKKLFCISFAIVTLFTFLVFFPLIIRNLDLPLTTYEGYLVVKSSLNDLSQRLEPFNFISIVESFESSLNSLLESFTSDSSFFNKIFSGITGIFSVISLPFKLFYNFLGYGFTCVFAIIRFILSLLYGYFS